ncbi:MAG: preprotein translocase subunit SecG [Ruminococcaceae bacterium]|nr:preprotein translocase subunit SecG [Oscillospiraceae bacterium]
MGILEIIAGVLLILCSVVIIMLVMSQQPKTSGMSAMTGGSDIYGEMQSRTADAKLAKLTKVAGIVFFVLTIAVSAIALLAK